MSKILAGRYEILEKIGDGGMAVVYRARDKLLNRPVAIKVLRPEYVTDANFVESFRRESRSAASLTHPNIVSIFDVGKDGNVYYIVMELVEGRPLSDIIREKGPLDYRFVLNISEQIASALSVAHRNNIIHRDVKPHNILITQDGHAKITDFGIARAVTDGTTVNDNTVRGTVHYFSPEQGRGMYMDERSDIYSLGVVMYEMLTGRVPFDADNAVAIAVMHMNDRMPPPSRIVPGVPPALEQIIMKATEKHQVNRFKTADDMLEALRNVDRLTGGFVNPTIAGAVRSSITDDADAYADGYGSDMAGGDDEENYDDDAYSDEVGSYAASGGAYYDEDDEDDIRARKSKSISKKRKDENRHYKIIAVIAAVVGAALLVYFVINPAISKLTEKKAEVPAVEDVLGKTEDEATNLLMDQGYVVEIGAETYSSDYKKGYVAEQDPAPGEPLAEGEIVTLHLSKGAEESSEDEIVGDTDEDMAEVPDLVGKSRASAEYAIGAAGFNVGEVKTEDSDKPMDNVIAQNPKAGKQLKKGETIDITISQGPRKKEVNMPNLIGLTEKQAKSAINKAGLLPGTVNQEWSDDYKKGAVMWQQYKKGKKLNEGQTVDFTVSKGPEDRTSTVSIDIDFSNAPADTFYLDVVLLQGDLETNIVSDEESYKAQGSKTVKIKGKGSGAQVIVYFDGVEVEVYDVDFNKGTVS
ncbi:MAG: Stk1 family PASTA domain-containing Ser/Thr kinase [Clostridiales Family XIII bacterium]|jgi:serine/threonine-protein kinase|nr:Stk1 family PASTA domain-containing Ser/Thr kinase [Clostridiales Family XIII bacterium]